MKSTLERYVDAKYPEETLGTLAYLESCSEHLGDLLNSYRYLQPDDQLFSVKTIDKIWEIHELEAYVANLEGKIIEDSIIAGSEATY